MLLFHFILHYAPLVKNNKAVLESSVMDHTSIEQALSNGSVYSCSNTSSEEECDTGSSCHTMGLRSPSGPMRGRSVKEFEEQLTNLKKENFNLKLRIYFLEEKMGTNFNLDKDNVVKKYVELQVEIANLKKELLEKQELLCQAVKAMDLEEEEHKKYVASKEEQLNQCHQEMDDLRMQLQESKFESDALSIKSDTTGFYSSRATNSGNLLSELQEKMKIMETELHLEKENNASMQIIIGQAETLKNRYETLKKESEVKDEQIKHLSEEVEAANEKILGFTDKLKIFQDKLETSYSENHALQKKIETENKKFEEVIAQVNELRKKYSIAKTDFEREHKRAERSKMMADMKISQLEEENERQKTKIRDLQGKLEAAMVEIKKNQNLAVSKSLVQKSNISNTDDNPFSVSNPATPSGTPKKNTFHVQVSQNSPCSVTSPSSPDKFHIDFEQVLKGAGEKSSIDQILSHYQSLQKEHSVQKQKIIKLKGEQLKACEIIKSMMASRNKANDEIVQLKKHIEELEHELESVVSKPDGKDVPLQQRVTSLNITAANAEIENSMVECHTGDLEISEHYKALTVELEAKIEILVATLSEKDAQMQQIRQQYDEILTSLEDKENRIVDLEFELLSADQGGIKVDRSLLEKADYGSEKHSSFYRQEMEEKDKEIERLTVELKKCTCYLQEIVNKELWEKNKEIEKMHNKQVNSSEIMKLKKELTGKEQQLKILKEKISELGLDISIPHEDSTEAKDLLSPSKNIQHIKTLQDNLKACIEQRDYYKEKFETMTATNDSCQEIETLKSQNEILQNEILQISKLKHDSNQLCTLLSGRLEELAIFLDSLLKQKSVLGFLGPRQNCKIREIIDNTLDLSRSFSVNMTINPDQSLAQLSNITALLNSSVLNDMTVEILQESRDITESKDVPEKKSREDLEKSICKEDEQSVLSIVPSNITLTYQSHLYKQKGSEPNNEEVILALREQIVNLKSELQLRDNELNKLNNFNSREVRNKTTETENEEINNKLRFAPQDVSKLFVLSNKSPTSATLKCRSEGYSESETWSEPDRVISRARIGLNQTLPAKLNRNNDNTNESTEDESASSFTPPSKTCYLDRRTSMLNLHLRISELEEKLNMKTVALLDAETKLLNSSPVSKDYLEELEKKHVEIQNELSKMEEKRREADCQVESLHKVVKELKAAKQELEESALAKDKETHNMINRLEAEKDHALKTAYEFKMEAARAKTEIEAAEAKLRQIQEDKSNFEDNIRKEYEQYAISKLKDAEEEFLKQLKQVEAKAEDKIKRVEEVYAHDFVNKSELEKKVMEVKKLIEDLDRLKGIIKTYEETIEMYKVKENEFRSTIQEYQEKINVLRLDLDNTTLQYSEAVLEKTKLANEKALFEEEVDKISVKESEMKRQFNEIQTEFTNIHQNYQQQISTLQKQKSKLEVKTSELESLNAELHNRLVRLQANCGNFHSTTSPNIGSRNNQLAFRRQYSDQNYSSEDNFEERVGFSFGRALAQNFPPGELERHENSSPDLGIESDHGRFSSLETNTNVSRPLLQTIELTESMSNLLDGDNNPKDEGSCGSDHCCQKSLEIAHENNDLKRKLLRMRRALEETAKQLNLANQRKKQVEKTICKQIHKTSQVLRKAKANLDSGSESDVLNKV